MNSRSVVVTLEPNEDGYLLHLDDAVRSDGKSLTLDVHYTNKQYTKHQIESLDLDDAELAEFAYAIFARLHAFRVAS
jgi:hypothetical protein